MTSLGSSLPDPAPIHAFGNGASDRSLAPFPNAWIGAGSGSDEPKLVIVQRLEESIAQPLRAAVCLVLLNSPIWSGTDHVRAGTILRSGEIVTGLLLSPTGQDV